MSELYTDNNISDTINIIIRETNDEYEIGAEDYFEEVKSRFYLLCKRIRDHE